MDAFVPLLFMALLLVVFLIVDSGRRTALDRQARQLAVVDRKVSLIMDQLGITEPESDTPPGVLQHLLVGEKIQAIKVYREATGAGLADAKRAVEQVARAHGLGR